MVEVFKDIKNKFPNYLNDESNLIKNPSADRIYFPRMEDEMVSVIKQAYRQDSTITVSGAGTGLSGGRVPYKGWIIATDKMKTISTTECELWTDPETGLEYEVKLDKINEDEAHLSVPVGMTLKAIQNYCRQVGWFYPPDPTERSSFIGGNVATNASGARSFKYGPTRDWVEGIHVILPDGNLLQLERSKPHGSISDEIINLRTNDLEMKIPRPKYTLPEVSKNVTGVIISDNSDPMDIFIGSNGIFGVISEVKLRLSRPPTDIVSIFAFFKTIEKAIEFVKLCQEKRKERIFPAPMSVEYLDKNSIDIMRIKDNQIPSDANALVMLEQDAREDDQLYKALDYWNSVFENMEVDNVFVAQSHQEIEHHKTLRHHVPEYIINLSRTFDQSLVVTDNSVPDTNFEEFFSFLEKTGKTFVSQIKDKNPLGKSPGYALFGHAGNSHPHLTLLPRDDEEQKLANDLLVDVLHKVVELGGAIAAEHGLGKKRYEGKPALAIQYGDQGLEEITKMKEYIDPKWILCRGNLVEPKEVSSQ